MLAISVHHWSDRCRLQEMLRADHLAEELKRHKVGALAQRQLCTGSCAASCCRIKAGGMTHALP